jgi:hypothetical protein
VCSASDDGSRGWKELIWTVVGERCCENERRRELRRQRVPMWSIALPMMSIARNAAESEIAELAQGNN